MSTVTKSWIGQLRSGALVVLELLERDGRIRRRAARVTAASDCYLWVGDEAFALPSGVAIHTYGLRLAEATPTVLRRCELETTLERVDWADHSLEVLEIVAWVLRAECPQSDPRVGLLQEAA
jgi:hypothetical protein